MTRAATLSQNAGQRPTPPAAIHPTGPASPGRPRPAGKTSNRSRNQPTEQIWLKIQGLIANALGTGDIFELNVLGFIVAVIAAVLLIGVAEGLAGRNRRAG